MPPWSTGLSLREVPLSRTPRRSLWAFFACAALCPSPVFGSAAVVPDEFASVQAAIDSGADTVLVREGNYPEVVQAYRGVALFGLGGTRPRLAGLMITNPFDGLSKAYAIRDLEFSGPDTIRTVNPHARLLDIAFTRCRLAQGLLHGSTDPNDIDRLVLSNCLIEGFFDARAVSFEMHSDTATAGVSCTIPDGFVVVDSCWFRGGDRYALRLGASDQTEGSVVGNVFEDTPVGLYLTNCFQVNMQSNIVRRASSIGMELEGQYIQLSDNYISNCGVGLSRSSGTTTLINNRIIRTSSTGAYFYAPEVVQAERNTVGQCGGSAIFVEFPSSSNLRFAQNTFYKAGSSGILIVDGTSTTLTAEGNVVLGAAAWGLQVVSTELSATLGCNDWFANGLGAASGVALGATDLAVDPGFCDVANDDVSLYSDSPLLSQSQCGQIGAHGVGCTPPSLSSLVVSLEGEQLAVHWAFSATLPETSWVERAMQAAGPWDSLGVGSQFTSGEYVLLDSGAAPEQTYLYRVAWFDRGSVVRSSPASGKLAIIGPTSAVTPNPTPGGVRIEWTLSSPAESEVRVFDLVGREVALVTRGSFPAGRHHVRWEGQDASGAAARAGWYVVRVRRGDSQTSHRVLLIR